MYRVMFPFHAINICVQVFYHINKDLFCFRKLATCIRWTALNITKGHQRRQVSLYSIYILNYWGFQK